MEVALSNLLLRAGSAVQKSATTAPPTDEHLPVTPVKESNSYGLPKLEGTAGINVWLLSAMSH